MKRVWHILIPGRAPFTMILMEDQDALTVARSIWPGAVVE